LIDWTRVYRNDSTDAEFIFGSMKNELIRHVYWHTPIENSAIERALKKSNIEMRERATNIVRKKIGKALNYREGYQTPKTGNEIIHYAQHATATCCRKCLEYWHNIKEGRDLTEGEIKFCTDLIMLFINDRATKSDDSVISTDKQKQNGLH
jgi:hypothetical protein